MNSDRPLETQSATSDQNPHQPNQAINTALGYVAVALPIVLVVSAIGYRKYRTHVLRKQIAKLERIWRLSPQGKTR